MRNSMVIRAFATPKRLTALGLAAGLLAVALVALAGQMVPFKGYVYGVFPPKSFTVSGTYYDHNNNPVVIENAQAGCDVVGHSTQLGNFTGTIFSTDGWATSLVVLRAANGDEVWGDATNAAVGGWEYALGGTGRFAGASGWWKAVDPMPVPPPGFIFAHGFDGVISSVGSNKK